MSVDMWQLRRDGETEPVLCISIDNKYGNDILTGRVLEAHVGTRTLRNYSSDGSDDAGFADLQVFCYLRDEGVLPYSSVTIAYREAFCIELNQAEAMAKMLRKVLKTTTKQYEKLGNCGTIGEEFRRAAEAFGCKYIVVAKTDAKFRSSSTYDENRDGYMWQTLGNGKNLIDGQIIDHYTKQGKTPSGEALTR